MIFCKGDEVWIRNPNIYLPSSNVFNAVVNKVVYVNPKTKKRIYGYIMVGSLYTYEKARIYPTEEAIYLAEKKETKLVIKEATKKLHRIEGKLSHIKN